MDTKEIINLGGYVETTHPLIVFVDAGIYNEKEEPLFATIVLQEKSELKIREEDGVCIYGNILHAPEALGLTEDDEMNAKLITGLEQKEFITTIKDFENCTYINPRNLKK